MKHTKLIVNRVDCEKCQRRALSFDGNADEQCTGSDWVMTVIEEMIVTLPDIPFEQFHDMDFRIAGMHIR